MKVFLANQVNRTLLHETIRQYRISQKKTLAGIHKVKSASQINAAIKTGKYPTLLTAIVKTVTRILNEKYNQKITVEYFLHNSQMLGNNKSLTNK